MKLALRNIAAALLILGFASAAAAQPVITAVNKAEAPRSGRVAIEGSGFGSGGQVVIADLSAWITTWTDTRIVAYVPEAAALGPGSLRVLSQGLESNSEPLTVVARQADGRVLWSFEADGSNLWWRPALSPDGTIYLHANNATDGIVYALSPDGALLWTQTVKWYPVVPPTAGPDGELYIGSLGAIYRISRNGDIDWQYADGVSRGPRVAPTIGPDGLLYGAFEGGIGAFAIEPLTGQLVWSNPGDPPLSDKSGDATEMKFGAAGPGGPVDQLYVSMDRGPGFYAFSLNGDQLFTAVLGNLKGTAEVAVGSDGTIYGPLALGLLVAALDPFDGATLWQYDPPDWAVGTENVEIGPDDILYFVGSGAKLEAFDPFTRSRLWQQFTPIDTLDRPTVTPDGSALVVTGADTDLTGNPGFVKAFDTADGSELWAVDLPFKLSPGFRVYGTHHPRITPDGATAYVSTFSLAEWPLNQDPHTFLFAIDLSGGPGDPPPKNQPPVAVATANPTSGPAPLTVTFDSTGSMDPDGTVMSFNWDFGDGGIGGGVVIGHTYANPGTYAATLTVTDDDNATASASVTIDVAGPPGVCTVDCLRSTDIRLSAKARRGKVTVIGKVKIQDETGAKIRNARVDGTWTLPGGGQLPQSVSTNRRGEAALSVAGGSGTYTLTVTDITKPGLTFDPGNSVLSKSITK